MVMHSTHSQRSPMRMGSALPQASQHAAAGGGLPTSTLMAVESSAVLHLKDEVTALLDGFNDLWCGSLDMAEAALL